MEVLPKPHHDYMKKLFPVLFALIFNISFLFGQDKVPGAYDPNYHDFVSKDTNVILAYRANHTDTLRPFMIKGENPFIESSNHVGFMDTKGNIIIKPIYNNCSWFDDNYALVSTGGGFYGLPIPTAEGLIDRRGSIKIPVIYNRLYRCTNGLFAAYKDGKFGFIDTNNNVIVPFNYSEYATPPPPRFGDGDDVGHREFIWRQIPFKTSVLFDKYIGVKSGNKWAVVDRTGKEIVSPFFDGVGIFVKELAYVKMGNKYGVINSAGKILVPAQYDKIEIIVNDRALAYIGDKVGVVDINNKLIVPIEYQQIDPFGPGYAAMQKDCYTLFDEFGKQVAKSHYAAVKFPVWNGYDGNAATDHFFITDDIAYNSHDKEYHHYQSIAQYDVGYYSEPDRQRIFYERDNKWGVMDTTGRELTPPFFDDFNREFSNSVSHTPATIFEITVNKKYGIINRYGKVLLDPIYDQPDYRGYYRPSAGALRFFVRKEGKLGLFEFNAGYTDIKQVIPAKYDTLSLAMPENMSNPPREAVSYRVRTNKKWGLLSLDGELRVPVNYDLIAAVFPTFVIVKNGGKYGIVNRRGELVADCVYDNAAVQGDHLVLVRRNEKYGLINSDGKIIVPIVYNKILPSQGKYLVKRNGKTGLLNGETGRLIIPCEYDNIRLANLGENTPKNPEYYIVSKNGRWGIIDSTGKVRLPIIKR